MIADETHLPLGQAARLLPALRGGRPVNPATLRRWASRGLRGVRLEIIRVGGTICTSREAMQRFFAALSAPGGEGPTSLQTTLTQKEVNKKLDEFGVR